MREQNHLFEIMIKVRVAAACSVREEPYETVTFQTATLRFSSTVPRELQNIV
jgi:hypothetical protein